MAQAVTRANRHSFERELPGKDKIETHITFSPRAYEALDTFHSLENRYMNAGLSLLDLEALRIREIDLSSIHCIATGCPQDRRNLLTHRFT